MLQLTHRDHARHMKLPFSSAVSVSMASKHATMQVLRLILGVSRRSSGGVHLLLTPHSTWGWFISCAGAALGAWSSVGCCRGVI